MHLHRSISDFGGRAFEIDAILQRRHQAIAPSIERQPGDSLGRLVRRLVQRDRRPWSEKHVARGDPSPFAGAQVGVLDDRIALAGTRRQAAKKRLRANFAPRRARPGGPWYRRVLPASSCARDRRKSRARRRPDRRAPFSAYRSGRSRAAGRTSRKTPGAVRRRTHALRPRPRPSRARPFRRPRAPLRAQPPLPPARIQPPENRRAPFPRFLRPGAPALRHACGQRRRLFGGLSRGLAVTQPVGPVPGRHATAYPVT